MKKGNQEEILNSEVVKARKLFKKERILTKN